MEFVLDQYIQITDCVIQVEWLMNGSQSSENRFLLHNLNNRLRSISHVFPSSASSASISHALDADLPDDATLKFPSLWY
jgi:hypothetical protein